MTWGNILFWIDAGLKTAEEMGITKANADEMLKSSSDPAVKRLLGGEGGFGALFGLDNDWLLRAIKDTGNDGTGTAAASTASSSPGSTPPRAGAASSNWTCARH